MDSTPCEKVFRKNVDTNQRTSCIPSEFPCNDFHNINTINFVSAFGLRSKPPWSSSVCVICPILPSFGRKCLQLGNRKTASSSLSTWPWLQTWLRTCLFAGIPQFRLEGRWGWAPADCTFFFQEGLQAEDPVKGPFPLHNGRFFFPKEEDKTLGQPRRCADL